MFRSGFKTQFPLRTAAISSRDVIGSKFVLDVALATPAAILNLRLARVNFARSRDESSFGTTSSIPHRFRGKFDLELATASQASPWPQALCPPAHHSRPDARKLLQLGGFS